MADLFSIIAQIPTRFFTIDQVLGTYIFVFYAAFLVSFFFTPVMRMVAISYGIIDRPDAIRKMHSVPVAYLGGVAVFIGWLCGMVIAQYLRLHRLEPGWPVTSPIIRFSIPMGALVIVVLGLWDDILTITPRAKIIGQVGAAMLLLWDGVGLDSMRNIIMPVAQKFHVAGAIPEWFIGVSSAVFVIVTVVGCCNATNLMDGLDGLCGGVTAIIAAGFVFVAVHLAMVGGGINTNWDALRVIIGLALLGAVLGFIPYNFNPASIFMGDTGSMLLGFCCSTLIILMAQERAKWFLAAMVMFALPVLDTALAFARRWINNRPLFSPDKQHFHHQMVARGFSVKQTVLMSYGLAIFFGLLGVIMVFLRLRYAVAMYLVIFGSIVVAAYKMGMIHERPRKASAGGLADEALSSTANITAATVIEVDEGSARNKPQALTLNV